MLEKNITWGLLSLMLLITAVEMQADHGSDRIKSTLLHPLDYWYLQFKLARLKHLPCICKEQIQCYVCRKHTIIMEQLSRTEKKPELYSNGTPRSPYVRLTPSH